MGEAGEREFAVTMGVGTQMIEVMVGAGTPREAQKRADELYGRPDLRPGEVRTLNGKEGRSAEPKFKKKKD